MKTSDEILLFLVKNSKPEYYIFPVDEMDTSHNPPKKKSKKQKLKEVLLRLSGVNRYVCETDKLENFLNEKVDFEKHLRQFHEEGILYFNGIPKPGDYYDSPEYRKVFAATRGQIRNYETKTSYVCFYYRENNFLEDYHNIKNNAYDIKLL
jgi:hypothetical protein